MFPVPAEVDTHYSTTTPPTTKQQKYYLLKDSLHVHSDLFESLDSSSERQLKYCVVKYYEYLLLL